MVVDSIIIILLFTLLPLLFPHSSPPFHISRGGGGDKGEGVGEKEGIGKRETDENVLVLQRQAEIEQKIICKVCQWRAKS